MIQEVESTKPLVHTVASASKALLISERAFWNAIQRGQVRIVKFGRSTRVPQAEVERIAKEGLASEAR